MHKFNDDVNVYVNFDTGDSTSVFVEWSTIHEYKVTDKWLNTSWWLFWNYIYDTSIFIESYRLKTKLCSKA